MRGGRERERMEGERGGREEERRRWRERERKLSGWLRYSQQPERAGRWMTGQVSGSKYWPCAFPDYSEESCTLLAVGGASGRGEGRGEAGGGAVGGV